MRILTIINTNDKIKDNNMNIEFYNEFIIFSRKGIRAKAKECINNFINSFDNFTEKELWTKEYLPKLEKTRTGYIRNELFEEIIFPVLLNGYKNKDISLMIWLVKLDNNYYRNKKIWKKINFKSSLEIIKECYEIDGNNNEIIDLYLSMEIKGIKYALHEWPCGILIDSHGMTLEDCKEELLKEIPIIRKLDINRRYTDFIDDYENKLKEYIKRLEKLKCGHFA
jgi:hypothetical protein